MTTSINDKIRLIVASSNGHQFAVAEFEKCIQVWDVNSGLICNINSALDFGGARMALVNDVLVVGSFNKGNVTAYSTETTDKIWSRHDLKKCQKILALKRPNSILVILDAGTAQILSTLDGSTIGELRGIKRLWESSDGKRALLEGVDTIRYVSKDEKETPTTKKTTFAILDACFTEGAMVVSYSAGPIEMRSLPDLSLKWSTKSNLGHFLNVGLLSSIDKVVAVRWDYENDGPFFLCHLNIETGFIEKEIDIGIAAETSFLNNYEFLLTSKGELLSADSSKPIQHFDF